MKKNEMIERLTAAGVQVDESASVKELTKLAADQGISLEPIPEKEIPKEAPKEAPKPEISKQQITAKIMAGLTREQAEEILKNQQTHDQTRN